MKLSIQQGIFILIAFLLSGCGLFENEQSLSLDCVGKELSYELIHVGLNNGESSYISALNAETLEQSYKIMMERGAPFQIHYVENKFFYTVDTDANQGVFFKRLSTDGARLDSIFVPKGASLFQLYTDVYVTYAAYSNPFTLINNQVVYEEYNDYIIQPIHKVENQNYVIYGNSSEVFFGIVDTVGITEIFNLTDIVEEVIPDYSFVYGMYYLKNENRLLITVEDYNRPPTTIFFDINLHKGTYKANLTGQHANIVPSENKMFFFLTHASSLRLSSKPTRHLTVYSVSEKRMFNLIDFQKELGENVYIQDIASDGCSLYAGVFSRNLGSMILKYNIETEYIDKVKKIGNGGTTITAIILTSNPKLNGELK